MDQIQIPNNPEASKQDNLVKDFSPKEEKKPFPLVKLVIVFIVILLGVGTGYLLNNKSGGNSMVGDSNNPKIVQSGKIVGSTDTKTFRDSTTGVIQKGGLDGEGTHKLIRPGGDSQTVYMTSSIVDLDQFVGKKVTLWGETIQGQKAAWLMDVGKIEVLQ